MGHRYEHIIAPLKIGNVVLKNRLLASKIISQELQGPEHFPAESTIKFVADLAKNGAAIVTCSVGNFPPKDGSPRSEMSQFYMENRRVQSYFNKMIDRIHAYNSLASASMMGSMPMNASISEIKDKAAGKCRNPL
jgi:2,4-dienoyl-CoA reductase-like NADH-dependent reductase (Old Yellow Enzyme family)